MAFVIDDYYKTGTADGSPPADVVTSLQESIRAAFNIYPQLCNVTINEQEIGDNLAFIIMHERPDCYFDVKTADGKQALKKRLSPVVMRFPNLAATISMFVRVNKDIATAEIDTTESTATAETSTEANTKEKYNPIDTQYAKMSGETNNTTSGTATNGGKVTTKREKPGIESFEALERMGNPLRPLARAIMGACVYTAEELEEVYYLNNAEDC